MRSIFEVVLILAAGYSSCWGLRCWDCNNARTNEECLSTGVLKECREKDAICENQIRHEQNGKTILIEKRCKQEHACDNNVNQNTRQAWPIQCNTKSPTSVCRCCCNTDGCNSDLMSCWNDIPQYDMPENLNCGNFPEPPQNGNMQCYGNLEPDTYCMFTCHDGFILQGQPQLTCLQDRTWDYQVPRCKMITCPPRPGRPGNGSIHCSDGINLRSRCRYMCHPDYELIGSSFTECIDVGRGDGTGMWTNQKPYCKPLVCPPQGPIRHGSITCTRGRKIRSNCRFDCATDFALYPAGRTNNQCGPGGKWTGPLPCCQLPCPPFALMDFIVVMDSSSSVGEENWIKMKTFVRSFLGDFRVRSDSAHYSVIRYNKVVDEATQILFSDYTDNIDGILRAFDAIPYDGSGTRTGNALNYTADVLLRSGNRPEAKDVVLLITDGASQDSVSLEAKKVRDSGALFFVLPVKPPGGGRLDMGEIADMAGPGNEDKIIRDALERGFDALDEEFAKRMSQLLCGEPCSLNPLHNDE